MTKVQPLQSNVKISDEDNSFEAIEVSPTADKRYVISVDVGDLPPEAVVKHLEGIKARIEGFFPSPPLLVPCRPGKHPTIGIYEIDPA